LIILLGTTGWFDIARLVRGEVQLLGQRDFVVAARAVGARRARILAVHILPHLVPLLIVNATLSVAGTIALDGRDLTRLPMHQRARHGIGYLPQEASVFRKLTVEENILAIVEVIDVPRAERATRVAHHLAELSLSHLAKQKAFTLSGGERRRLEIARALVTRPKFLLMDEPFAAIDPISVAEVQKIILELKARGIGIINHHKLLPRRLLKNLSRIFTHPLRRKIDRRLDNSHSNRPGEPHPHRPPPLKVPHQLLHCPSQCRRRGRMWSRYMHRIPLQHPLGKLHQSAFHPRSTNIDP
jgi:ABC-type ATPase involved in cell division